MVGSGKSIYLDITVITGAIMVILYRIIYWTIFKWSIYHWTMAVIFFGLLSIAASIVVSGYQYIYQRQWTELLGRRQRSRRNSEKNETDKEELEELLKRLLNK